MRIQMTAKIRYRLPRQRIIPKRRIWAAVYMLGIFFLLPLFFVMLDRWLG